VNANRAKRRQAGRSGPASGSYRWLAAAGTILLLAAIAAVAVVNRRGVQSASEAPIYAALSAGQKAPAFDVTTVDGRRIDSRQISGPILLEVFATWCPHCQRETVTLNDLHRRFGKDLTIVSVSGSNAGADGSSPESADGIRRFVSEFGVTYPVAYDPDLAVAKNYLQGGFPTLVFINPQKRVTAFESGEVGSSRLESQAKEAGATPSR
jgi:peroxiredoxin